MFANPSRVISYKAAEHFKNMTKASDVLFHGNADNWQASRDHLTREAAKRTIGWSKDIHGFQIMGQGPVINLLETYFDIPSNTIAGLQDDLKNTQEEDLHKLDTKLYKLKALKTKLRNCLTRSFGDNIEESMPMDVINNDGRIYFCLIISRTFPDKDAHKEIIKNYFVKTFKHHNQDDNPGINDKFLNNLDPTCCAMQMQNPDVLTHAQMKQQVDADKFISAQHPKIEGLLEMETYGYIPKSKLPSKTRYVDLIWTYRRKRCPDGSLKKYKARLYVNGSRQIQGIDYMESSPPVVQLSTIRMVNTLAAMHNLKGKQIDFIQAFPQAKLKEDIYLRFPAGYEHMNDEWAIKNKLNIGPCSSIEKLVPQTKQDI
jgi:hypothetical protein